MPLNLQKSSFGLRPMTLDDAEMVRRWRNQPHIRRNMYTDHEIGMEEHMAWTRRVIGNDQFDYLIFSHLGRPLGLVGFYNLQPAHRRGDWAFYLGEADVPRGAGPAMEFFALDHFFAKAGMDKLCCEVFTFNSSVIKLHERFGFRREGLRKAHFFKQGEPEDIVELAMLRSDWNEAHKRHATTLFAPD